MEKAIAMYRRLCIIGLFLIAAIFTPVMPAQEPVDESFLRELIPRFRRQAVLLDISARVVEQNRTITWIESHQKVTVSGRPVELKLVGANVIVAVQFTPYLHRNNRSSLVAQGQIWTDVPNQGVRYSTTMQTIPIQFDESVYFFPLGPLNEEGDARVEIKLTMQPYERE